MVSSSTLININEIFYVKCYEAILVLQSSKNLSRKFNSILLVVMQIEPLCAIKWWFVVSWRMFHGLKIFSDVSDLTNFAKLYQSETEQIFSRHILRSDNTSWSLKIGGYESYWTLRSNVAFVDIAESNLCPRCDVVGLIEFSLITVKTTFCFH